jgi:hypothetical protein
VPAVDAPKQLWLFLVGIALLGIYAAVVVLVYAGHRIGPEALYGSGLWHGLFFYLWWRKIGRNGWHGAVFGFFVGILAFSIAAFLAALMRHWS